MALRNSVPKRLRGPIGFASIIVAILGIVVGYIFVMFGITLYFDMNALPKSAITPTESFIVIGTGLLSLLVGYVGWRGFNHFAY
ncbi:hypothetical protein [Halomicrococcus sp. SG-WS-1]|uniref:hypothetical protein n=1 Tax=Halomicrococcus sp. SG-WS-1 TaxID=3439057 RepID=UPI003F78FF86